MATTLKDIAEKVGKLVTTVSRALHGYDDVSTETKEQVQGVCTFPFVDEDSRHGMRLIAEHLIDLGHRRIGFIAASDDLMFAHYRLIGFREGLQQRGITVDETLIMTGDLTHRSGYENASKLFNISPSPTAIAACNDLMALGAISAAHERQLDVGKDIAIAGFDDIPLAEHSHPPLTTVHQPIYKIGLMVCEMLIRGIIGKTLEQKQIILKPSLIIRQSCGEG